MGPLFLAQRFNREDQFGFTFGFFYDIHNHGTTATFFEGIIR